MKIKSMIFIVLLILTSLSAIYIPKGMPFIAKVILNNESNNDIIAFIQIEPEYVNIESGSKIFIGLIIFKKGSIERQDVLIKTFLKSPAGSVNELASETIAVENKASIVLSPIIPSELKSNSYEIEIEIRDVKNNALLTSANQRIIVLNNAYISFNNGNIPVIIAIVIVILIMIIFIIISNRKNKDENDIFKYK